MLELNSTYRIVVIAAAIAAATATAWAQTGPFQNSQNWITVGGSTTLLINTDADATLEQYPVTIPILANNVGDVDFRSSADGSLVYARAFGSALSGACAPTDNQIYFFRTVQDNDAGGHLDTVFNGGVCINGPLPDDDGLFQAPVGGQEIAFVVEAKDQPSSTRQSVHWFNLNGVNERGESLLNVDVDAVFFDFAPDGTAAIVKHGLPIQPTSADYTLVDLCAAPRLGNALTSEVGGVLFGLSGDPTVAVVEEPPGSGDLVVRITHPDIGASGALDVPLVPCAGGQVMGACCEGGCTVTDQASCNGTFFAGDTCTPDPCVSPATEGCCLDSTGECVQELPADCIAMGGTPQGAGSDCSSPSCPIPQDMEACCCLGSCFNVPVGTCNPNFCTLAGPNDNCFNGDVNCPPPPMANLSISKTGPVSVTEGQEFDYVITYGNSGPDPSQTVRVTEQLPAGAVLVAATDTPDGIAPTLSGTRVTWDIPSLAAGATNQQVTVTARAPCNIAGQQFVNDTYSIQGSPGGLVNGSPVMTNVTAAAVSSIGVSVISTDVNGAPLRPGDVIEHTITLTELFGVDHFGVVVGRQFGGHMQTGNISTFDAEVDAAGGAFSIGVNARSVRWVGDLGANQSINIVFRTRLDDCVNASIFSETLNRGDPIFVFNPCNQQLGSTIPSDVFDIVQPIQAQLGATNLGPPKGIADISPGLLVQLARVGQTLQFEMILTNTTNQDLQNVSAETTVPGDLIVNDPPFVGAVPAGASYDSTGRRIVFLGTVPAASDVVINWEAVLDPTAGCTQSVQFAGNTDNCPANNPNIRAAVELLLVPDVPADPHVIGVDAFQGMWLAEPGVDNPFKNLLCIRGEIYTGIAQTSNGELWVSGLPVVQFNPNTLDCETYGQDFYINTLGLTNLPSSVAYDPADDSVIFCGPGAGGGAVVRYDPATGTANTIAEDPAIPAGRCIVDLEGHIAVMGFGSVVRIDPADAANFDEFLLNVIPNMAPPGAQFASNNPTEITLDVDGDYLMMIETAWFDANFNLFTIQWMGKLDRLTGAFTTLADNLLSLSQPIPNQRVNGAVVGPNTNIYMGQSSFSSLTGSLFQIRRNRCIARFLGIGDFTNPFDRMGVVDLVFSRRITTAIPSPDDADGDGVSSCLDNCPFISNPGQVDTDSNGVGDACSTFVGTLGLQTGFATPRPLNKPQQSQTGCGAFGMVSLLAIFAGFVGLSRRHLR